MKKKMNMKKEIRLISIIVTYYPDKDLLIKNIQSIINYVDEILIWENTLLNDRPQYRYVSDSKVSYHGEEENSITHALNYAWKYAVENKYDYLLTMDQDSVWENFDGFLQQTIYNTSCPSGIWGPNLNTYGDTSTCFSEVRYLINSGMLQSVDTINKVGGWREDFRIDAFDIEYCYHAKELGIKCYRVGGYKLEHTLGNPSVKRVFGKQLHLLNYSPSRLYEIYRNHIIVIRKYKETKDLKRNFLRFWMNNHLVTVILGENNKWKKLCAICRGVFSGLTSPISR